MIDLTNKTVLITGGTGSFGKNFSRYLLKNFKLKKLIIFSRDELKQFNLNKEFEKEGISEKVRFFIGDVRDLQRLERAFQEVDVVVHAAALKQVPTLEYNPFEAIKTNVLGSQNVINAAIDQGVKHALLISTDKAAQPVNLYGSTKLCAEKLFINGNSYTKGKTKFSCVRYGNVIGSRGSIIETIIKNKDKEKLFITDKEMTRFWITLNQAFDLVMFALNNMNGGEVFIPKAPSKKLVDIFNDLAPEIKLEVIGIRPGEKLHEVLLTKEEARHAKELEDYYVILPEYPNIFNLEKDFKNILEIGKDLEKDFSYTSDTNTQWLSKDDLIKIAENFK